MSEWSAFLRLEPCKSRLPARLAELLAALPGIHRLDPKGPWEGTIALPEYPAFVEVCRLASPRKAFHAQARGITIEWRRHRHALLCGRDRTLVEPKGLGPTWCQGGPRESIVEPVESYPTPCKTLFVGNRYETPWLFDFGKPAGGHGWELDHGLIRERAHFLVATLDPQVCPWFPFLDDAALDAWLGTLPALIEAGPDSPYEVVDGILGLRPNDFGPRVRPIDRKMLKEFLEGLDPENDY